MRKICSCGIVFLGVVILLLAISLTAFLGRPELFGMSVYKVSSPSMAPGIPVGSAAYVRNDGPGTIGDIVVYRDGDGQDILHRIVGRDLDGRYILKGDANVRTDPEPVSESQISGRMVIVIENANTVGTFLFLLCAIFACLGFAVILIGWSMGRKQDFENDILWRKDDRDMKKFL